MKQLLLPILLFFVLNHLSAQDNTQSITGTIQDQQSEMLLIGATVELISEDAPKGTVTDENGYFKMENIKPGRYDLRVSYLGYETKTIPNVEVTSGKSVVLTIQLSESFEKLNEVVVKASKDKSKTVNELATVSARTFSVEEVTRYSGGRMDVGRLAANFAGVSTTNDARNDIVIRGNSPTGVLWRLEGIPIPNPNHYSTLGTTGGPVSALNPNLLKNSDFLTSAFPSEYGNALSGVFDLGFRNGNKEENEYMFQLGAVSGLEFMAEGPLNGKKNSSFIVAGRYSFIGLASEAGLDIGTNATPDYQDLAFKVDFGNSKFGKFTLFGVGGRSDIEFIHDELDESDLFSLRDEDSSADSYFGVGGIKHNLLLNETTYLRSVVSYSVSGNIFDQERIFNLDTEEEFKLLYQTGENIENRISVSSYLNKKFSSRYTARIGILFERYDYDLLFSTREGNADSDEDGIEDLIPAYLFNEGTNLIQAFAQTQYRLTKKTTLNLGIRGQYLALNETSSIEPRLALNYEFLPNQEISIAYGLHSQSQPLPILLLIDPETGEETNRNLDFTQSHHFVLAYDYTINQDWRIKAETYYQLLRNVPVESSPSSFSMLNIGDDFGFPTDVFGLVNDGTGFNRGVELTVEKFFSKGYYGLLTTSLYESKYEGSDGIERHTAFDNTYVVNLLAGKEFKVGKEKQNAITFDTKLTTAGGRRFRPIDLEASIEAGREIDDLENAYTVRFDPYLRWDVKIGFKRNSLKSRVTHHFFFDMQNVTNRDNIFLQRYNRLDQRIEDVFQIGFFPDFMYRIQF